MQAVDHDCVVPDCPLPGLNQIGVRCRVAHDGKTPFPTKGRTDAMFSIETGAFLCDRHALNGCSMTLMFSANDSQEANIQFVSGELALDGRCKAIRQPLEVAV